VELRLRDRKTTPTAGMRLPARSPAGHRSVVTERKPRVELLESELVRVQPLTGHPTGSLRCHPAVLGTGVRDLRRRRPTVRNKPFRSRLGVFPIASWIT
jgi:hypothetical protein